MSQEPQESAHLVVVVVVVAVVHGDDRLAPRR
jgi:Sec-independent protein translocase protein TatA